MKKILLSFVFSLLFTFGGIAQTTITKNNKEFFNGDDRHLYAYLNNNYHQLDPLEGIWSFTRVEYNEWGLEVSRTPNEYKAAIVRDKGNVRRAFVEVNFNRLFCKDYQITYSIQTGGGSGVYPLEPEGCASAGGYYTFNSIYNTISRSGVALVGHSAALVGVRIFPQGPPTEIMPMPGGSVAAPGQATPRIARTITHASGWEPYIDWGKNIFPSYLLSMGTIDPKTFPKTEDYLGDPLSIAGILVNAPKSNSEISIEIDETEFTRKASETFNLAKKGRQYAIFPKISWNYEKLRGLNQATPLDFTFKVTLNGKTTNQTATANLRALDDCPLFSYDYKGDPIDLKFLAAAYVNEGHPKVKEFMKDIRQKGLIRDFSGIQGGDEGAVSQVYAFWKLLRDKGISYSSITNNGQTNKEVASQRIRLLEDVMDETQANCIDGTALFASCLEAISIPSVLIFVPGHAFLGYYTLDNEGKIKTSYFLETTMLGGDLQSLPSNVSDLLAEEPYPTMRKALYQQFNGGKSNQNPQIDHFIAASLIGQLTLKKHLQEHPDAVMMINMADARKLVKPIYRSGNVGSTASEGSLSNNTGKKSTPQNNVVRPQTTYNPTTPKSPENIGSLPKTQPAYAIRRGTESYDLSEFKTDAPAKQGEYYKVQVHLTANYIVDKTEYLDLKKQARLDIELLMPDLKMTRVMLGDFDTEKKARSVAKKAQSLGFNNVAIVRYQDGNRKQSIYRDWKALED